MARRLGLVALLALLVWPAAARAQPYTVTSCADPGTGARVGSGTPGGWTFADNAPDEGNFIGFPRCGSDGLRISPASVDGATTINANNSDRPRFADWIFTAPAGTAIQSYDLWKAGSLAKQGTTTFYEYGLQDGAPMPGLHGLCHGYFQTCGPGTVSDPFNAANKVHGDGPLSELRMRLGCDAPTCPRDGVARADMYGATLQMTDSAAPTFAGPNSANLWSGPQKGTRQIDVAARDDGSGIRQALVTSSATGDRPVATAMAPAGGDGCARGAAYTAPAPCPATYTFSALLDTTTLPDGKQTLTIDLRDASGNGAAAPQKVDVEIANGITTPLARALDNGTGAADNAILSAAWKGRKRPSLSVKFSSRPTITGRLTTAAGVPIAGATIDLVGEQQSATTAANGTFSAKLAKAGRRATSSSAIARRTPTRRPTCRPS